MNEPIPGVVRQGDWFVLVDPAWDSNTHAELPAELTVGGWHRENDGAIGPFHPNPKYRPSADSVPTDPIDALLRRIPARMDRLGDELVAIVRESIVAVGCDEKGRPLIGTGPDGVSCVVVATAELQKAGVDVDGWRPVHGAKLSEVVPAGVQVFLNPAGGAPFRLAQLPS